MGLKDTNAGFKWTPEGGTEQTLKLQFPIKLDVAAGSVRRRATSSGWGTHTRVTFRSSTARDTFRARVRFIDNPKAFLDFLDEATLVGADYYPDLSQSTSYPVEILNVGRRVRLQQDEERFSFGEYEYRMDLRSSDGTDLSPLF